MTGITTSLHIVGMTDRGVQCVTLQSTAWPFWLPRGMCVRWAEPPQVGNQVGAIIPAWLAGKHKQLTGDQAYEEAKRNYQRPSNQIEERTTQMADREMTGSLSKNTRKEKPSHADYNGSIMIEGRKYWLNGWVKDGDKGKFLSLSVRPAEERTEPRRQAAAALEDDAIPFAPEVR